MSQELPPPPKPKKGISKKTIIIIAVVILVVIIAAVISYIYLRPTSTGTTYHDVFHTGYIIPHDQATQTYTTEAFSINGAEWYIKWEDWQGTVTTTTRLDIVVCDGYSNAVVKTLSLTTSHTEDYLNTKGRFYLKINTNTPNTGLGAFNVNLEVWESQP